MQHELLLCCGHIDLDLVVIFIGISWIALSPWSVNVTITGLVYNGAEGCKNTLTKPSYLKKLGEEEGVWGRGGGRDKGRGVFLFLKIIKSFGTNFFTNLDN